MKIRNILNWSLLIALISVASVLVFSNSTSFLHQEYHQTSSRILADLLAAQKVDEDFQTLHNLVIETYDYNDLPDPEVMHATFSQLLFSVKKTIKQLSKSIEHDLSVEKANLLNDVNKLLRDINQWAVLSAAVVGVERSSKVPSQFHVEQTSLIIKADLVKLVERYHSALQIASVQNRETFESTIWFQLIIYLILVGLCLVFAVRHTKNILDSLVRLKSVMSSLASGDLSVDVPLEKCSGDIADISDSVLHFKNSMIHLHTANNTINSLASRDYLTKTGNRRGLYLFIEARLAMATVKPFWLVQVDLNKFKEINDVYGHISGDAVLKAVSERMMDFKSKDEYVARMGGDEFVLVLDDVGASQAKARIIELESLITGAIPFKNRIFSVGASIGVAHYPDHSVDTDVLLHLSDLALYRMKKDSIRTIYFVDEELIEVDMRKKRLANEIPGAIEEKQFCAYFQPKIALPDYDLAGFEALVRWVHPTDGILTPAHFLDEIESSGLNFEIGKVMIDCTINALTDWRRKGYDNLLVSINVSEQELLDPSYADNLITRVAEANIGSSTIALEVLETTVIRDDKPNIHMNLRKLREASFEIHIDDFGVGYSSASSVIQTQFDTMKIDRSLVCTVESSEKAKKVFKSMIDLAKELNMKSCVEGVETQAELDMLIQYGADIVQGYFFCKPQDFELTTQYLSEYYQSGRLGLEQIAS